MCKADSMHQTLAIPSLMKDCSSRIHFTFALKEFISTFTLDRDNSDKK